MLANIARWFTEDWQIWRLQTQNDAWGNPIETWAYLDDFLGRLRPLSGDRKLSADRKTEFADAKIYCPLGTDILVGDELRNNGEVYIVLYVQNPMSMDEFLQVELKLKG